jgi:hypothetical protein
MFSALLMTASALDLKNAVVVTPPNLPAREKKAVQMLVEEAEKRSRVLWPIVTAWPTSNSPVIVVGDRQAVETWLATKTLLPAAATTSAEGYHIALKSSATNSTLFVVGNDERGVLFGAGRLLRELRMERGSVNVDDNLNLSSAPKYPLRGHQLGYRPKTHSYDAWDLPVWEQYFRDLIVFGCNAVELIPPRSDDDATSPHFPRPPMEMMIGMSKLADDYGLDVWIWYPAMDRDYSDPKTVEFAMREWSEVFSRLPRIDAVFVPGGDPGHTQPKYLMALLEKQTENLHRHHPKAQMWVSPQSFNQAWLDEFIGILKSDEPSWLSGVVHGPQVRVSIGKLRELVPQKYPIRHYPDITHSRQCQVPVPDWDTAFAVTEARECINPRPLDQAAIFRKTQPGTIGFLTYSEGCNDDVNKCIWSALGWDPESNVTNILRQYSRYFISERYENDFAEGLLMLERNWRGPLLTNESVDTTLAHFQKLEKAASPADLKNWRFQQALFRAYYDAYTRQRLAMETELELTVLKSFREYFDHNPSNAFNFVEMAFQKPKQSQFKVEWRERIFALAESLFQSISMQLSVPKYKAIGVDRGASLDTLDFPLNNAPWLRHEFARIRKLKDEDEQLKAVNEILNWTNPGAGGFYDDLGHVGEQPHLVQKPFDDDPERMQSPRNNWEEDPVLDSTGETAAAPRRVSWMDHAEALYDAPLQMRYTGLDPKAQYKLRVVYGGDNPRRQIRCVANDSIEIHGYMLRPVPFKRLEFSIPQSATASGELNLSWFGEPGLGGNGRGCQVSAVWLMRVAD